MVQAEALDLDRAATTPLHPDVLLAMTPWFGVSANASSVHGAGRRARRAVEDARERIAASVGARPQDVVLTSGATEAIQLGILGVMASRPGAHVVASRIEHAAVLRSVERLEAIGHPVTWISPERDGRIDPAAVAEALRDDTALVALMRVNNETGVLTDLAPIAEAVHARGAWLFSDTVQAFGFETLRLQALGADLIALSAHKVQGPQGVGALLTRPGLDVQAQALGGPQERGHRAGTIPVALVVGFGEAAERADLGAVDRATRVAALRDRLEAALLRLPGVHLSVPAGTPRGPKHAHVRVDGLGGQVETLLMNLDAEGVWASAGSACAAGSLEASHVLLAMGWSPAEARSALRFSLGDHLAEVQVDEAAARFSRALARTLA